MVGDGEPADAEQQHEQAEREGERGLVANADAPTEPAEHAQPDRDDDEMKRTPVRAGGSYCQ